MPLIPNGYGGYLVNKTGAASVLGTVVDASTATDFAFTVAPGNAEDAIGVVLEDGVADGDLCYVVFGGLCQVLLEDSSASTRGNWVQMSATAGRVDATAGPPPGVGPDHWEEVGHCVETKSDGTDVLCWIVAHFN